MPMLIMPKRESGRFTTMPVFRKPVINGGFFKKTTPEKPQTIFKK